MRSLVFVWAAAMAVACGPSAAQINAAKTATYKTEAAQLMSIAESVAAEDYKIGERNQEELAFMTVPQWYSPDGGRQSAGAGDYVQVGDRSVQVAFIVQVVEVDTLSGANYSVKVTPKVFQHISGSPQPRELTSDDPNMPGWVHGRVDSLYVGINEKAKQFQTN